MSFLRRLYDHFEEYISMFLLVVLILLTNFEVFRRLVTNFSVIKAILPKNIMNGLTLYGAFSEEIIRYVLVIMVYIGISYIVKVNRHIICNVIPPNVSQKLQFIIYNIMTLLCVFFFSVMAYAAFLLVSFQYEFGKETPASNLPMWPFTMIVIIGFLFCIVRQIELYVHDVKKYRKTGIIYENEIQLD